MNSQEMIESYVHEVGQQLPRKMRADIELELRSLLADALEDRDDQETAVVDFLKELGSPANFAAKYLPHQYLVGPELFPTFKLVGTIVFTVVTVLTVVALAIQLGRFGLPENVFNWWGQEMSDYVQNLIYVLGMITLIFAGLDYFGVGKDQPQSVWDPRSLRPVQDPSRINRGELIGAIVGGLFSIWVVSKLPEWIGIDSNGFFTDGYVQHIPWLVASWVGEIVLKGTVLINGRWSKVTRWAEITLNSFDVYVLYRIVSGVILISVAPFDSLVKGALAIAMIVVFIDILFKLYRVVRAIPHVVINTRSKVA